MAFGIWFVNKTNAFTHIICTFGIQAKKYGIKNLVTNATKVVVIYMQILHVTYVILT